ncbi:hypothetical protein Dsin_013498 [Dipteronia sinensis]|uniref:Homeobox-leucine zipper protein n=1 Tax=Dipteronia sinensis TaxID=43782 RepID=A0AAE0AKK5_9ROSI|nr:hypothetical protein Dsin_013498 [Dipteronia sinensis]
MVAWKRTLIPVIFEDKDDSDEEESKDAMDTDEEEEKEEAVANGISDFEGSDAITGFDPMELSPLIACVCRLILYNLQLQHGMYAVHCGTTFVAWAFDTGEAVNVLKGAVVTADRSKEFQSMLDIGLDEEVCIEESGGHVSEKKRRLSVDQVKALEKNFEVENKLEPERKVKLAQELGLQPRQVDVWFQNCRARWKTKQLERDYFLVFYSETDTPIVLSTYYNRIKSEFVENC